MVEIGENAFFKDIGILINLNMLKLIKRSNVTLTIKLRSSVIVTYNSYLFKYIESGSK